MASSTYRILDEPGPVGGSRAVVNPFWPLLAVMFAGAWLAWPWFAWNAHALGSPTKKKEISLALLGVLVTAAIGAALLVLADRGVLEGAALRYAALSISVWKLGLSYWLHVLQSRTFHLYEHFGGAVKNGAPVIFAGALLGRPLVLGLVDHVLWRIVVGS